MTPDQLRKFAQKLTTNTHVTLLNLNYESIGPDVLLELVGPLALLTSLRELHLAGTNTLMPSCLSGNMSSDFLLILPRLVMTCAHGVARLTLHSFESKPASLTLAGNGITGTSGALSALASSLSGLTALRILDLSGAHALAVFSGCSHPRPDSDIDVSSANFLPSLVRLHDLESLNLSGTHAALL
jgi:hypothetical protein